MSGTPTSGTADRGTLSIRSLTAASARVDHSPATGEAAWRCPASGVFVIESYALVAEAIDRPQDFSNRYTLARLDPGYPAEDVEAIYRSGGCPWARTLAANDAPDHRRFRSSVERTFSAAKVNALESWVRALAVELLDAWPPGVVFDAVSGFCSPLPLRIIARELGIPEEDAGRIKRWSDAALSTLSLQAAADDHIEAARCGVEFQQYFGPLLEGPELQSPGSLLQVVATRWEGVA